MIIKNGLIRNLKYILYNVKIAIPQFILIPAIIFVYSYFTGVEAGIGMIAMMCVIMSMSMSMSYYTVQYRYIINFSSTKKNFYIASISVILLYSVIMVVLGFIADKVIRLNILNSPVQILGLLLITIFVGFVGAFMGIVMYRSVKLGIFVIILLYVLIMAGLMFYLINISFEVNSLKLFLENIVLNIIAIAGIVILGVANWFLMRKLEIKT